MQTKYTIHSWPAIVGGSVAAGGAISLLTRDAHATGLSLDHALMPVLVGLTILSGHLVVQAVKEWKPLSFVGFLALAILGSGITVYETMGRRAETRDAKVAQATRSVDQYAEIAADYQRAAKLASEAEAWVAGECKTGLGAKCKGNQFILAQRSAHAASLKAQLERATAPAPADPKADRAAAVAGLLGLSEAVTKRAVQTFEPFVLPLFLELGAIFLFGFGVQHRKVTPVVSLSASPSFSDSVQTSFSTTKADDVLKLFADPLPENDPEPPKPRKTKKPTNVVRFPTVKHPVIQVLETSGRTMSNGELAKAMGVSDSEASKRWQEVSEQLEMGWNGKFRTIGLKAWKATA